MKENNYIYQATKHQLYFFRNEYTSHVYIGLASMNKQTTHLTVVLGVASANKYIPNEHTGFLVEQVPTEKTFQYQSNETDAKKRDENCR